MSHFKAVDNVKLHLGDENMTSKRKSDRKKEKIKIGSWNESIKSKKKKKLKN